MFDVGWSEMLVIAVILIVVVGPKDLPRMLRQFGRTTSKLRAMAGDFRRQFDDALKEAELDDVSDAISSVRKINPMNEIRKHLAPIEDVGQQVRSGLDDVMKPQSRPTPAETPAEPVAAEPLKNGAAGLPGEAAPAAEPAKPKKKPARATAAKAGTAKASTAKAGAARAAKTKASASKGGASASPAAAPKAPRKAAASGSKNEPAEGSKSRASKAGTASARKAPAKNGPANRKKTGSAR